MIGKAKSISHGINGIRYITGEARNKKHPELIYHVKDNLLPCRLDAQGVWDMMKAHAPMAKNVIRIEISPAKEHTEHFTMKDWEKLWDDFVREYDSMEFRNAQGEIYSHRTNLAGSVPTVPSGDGGGTSNDLPWGRKEVEDEMERARRCARTAIRKLGKKPKSSIRR